jgi:FKBP-type peptidyl-prolyl cis-trans isomerase FkpA
MRRRILMSVVIGGLIWISACSGREATSGAIVDNITTLQISDSRVGTGAEAVAGRQVTVHYTGWLYDSQSANDRGRRFDSSRDRNEPFTFRLGAGNVIRGWDQGVAGMRVGGVRTLVIPSALGYGSEGAPGVIPPNATLVFDVELQNVK